ncbi:hypothetical protein C2E23DRAFT_880354 [Lenzites betulinus]|nr:hypothetical protein C2E23DRAFT_880351 [Lenzites betulinus]KAH9858955.1 hypothetical protein C2E23DRAFT_880354 [Lenzites betulinus]
MSTPRSTRGSTAASEREKKRARTDTGEGSPKATQTATVAQDDALSALSAASSSDDDTSLIADLFKKRPISPSPPSIDIPPSSSPQARSETASSDQEEGEDILPHDRETRAVVPPRAKGKTSGALADLGIANKQVPEVELTSSPNTGNTDLHPVPTGTLKEPLSSAVDFPKWVIPAVQKRLRDMMDFTDVSTRRFAVAEVPESARWGRSVDGVDNSRFFCVSDEPLTVWLCGTMTTKWFQNRLGQLQDRVSVGLGLLRERDIDAAVKLLALSEPVKEPKRDIIYAGRFMTEWVKGKSMPVVQMFEEIYDASRPGMRRADLPRKMHYDLGPGDLLLVEAFLIRYKTGDTKKDWETWNTSFELRSISLIAEVPIGPVVSSQSSQSLHADERIL